MNQSGLLRRFHGWFALFWRALDVGAVFTFLPALCVWNGVSYSRPYQVAAMLGALLTWFAMGLVDAYRPWRGVRLWQEFCVIVSGWALVVLVLLVAAWACKSTQFYSRVVMGEWFVLMPLLLGLIHAAGRMLLRLLRKHGRNTRTAIVVGAGVLGRELASRIRQADWMGVRVIGFFDDATGKPGTCIDAMPVLGKSADVYDYVRREGVDRVYLALPMRAESRMRDVFDQLQDTTASVFLVPDLFVFELMGAREQDVAGLPVFSLCESPLYGPFGLIKRVEDIALAICILGLIWPLMLLIAIGVKFSSPGSVLFKQHRYGLNGELIKVYKFRSMTVCEDSDDVPQVKKGDARVTKFGAFLRRTSLDELPQFFNVLQGRMSVVGPRPHAVAHNEQYRKMIRGYMWRHKVRPGITGWAQVNGWRGETDTLEKMRKRVECDLDYIRRWSVWLDIKIVLLTLIKGFSGRNAY